MSVAEQVSSDYMLAASGKSRLVLLESSLLSAQAISQAWDRQFLTGQKSWLDVMNSMRELAQIELQIADVKASALLLTWRLALYTQGVDVLITQGKAQFPITPNPEPMQGLKSTPAGVGGKAFGAGLSLAPVIENESIVLQSETVLHSFISSQNVVVLLIPAAEKSVGSLL